MPAISKNGQWVFEEEEQQEQALPQVPLGLTPTQEVSWLAQQQRDQELQQLTQQREQEALKGADNRPFFAESFGQGLGDTAKIAANAAVAIGTDYLDLVAGVGDVAGQLGSVATGNGWDWGKVMDDSDNPWTTWRRNQFRTETQAGQAVSNIVRIGTALVALPKVAIKGVAFPFKVIGKADKLGDLAEASRGIGNLFTKLDEAVKGLADVRRPARMGIELAAAEKAMQKGAAAQKAASRAARNDWLTLTYEDVSKSIAKAPELTGITDWFDTVRTSTKALTQLGRGSTKAKIATVGEALAWDAFVAFNVYGEGDAEFDETLGDLAMSSGIPWLQSLGSPTATYAEDAGLVRKAKQMMEGVVTGAAFNAALDMVRVYQYAKNFKAASPADRSRIIEAMNRGSQEIGDSLGRTLRGAEGPIGLLPPRQGGALVRVSGANASGISAMDMLSAQMAAAREQSGMPGEFMAQQLQQETAWRRGPTPLLPGGPEDLNSPVQNRLAQMEGLASEFNEDPLYQEWLLQRLPQEELAPPELGDNPALRQFTGQGAMPEPSGPPAAPTPDDLEQYRAWLEERARLPEAELDPRVQQSLRRLDGVGELAPVPQQPPGQMVPPGGVEPVTVRELRPAEATVTPQTIRSAFERDAFRAFTQASELTFEEGPDGVMRSMAQKVRQLMPRTRVDALEYLRTFRPEANRYGVIPAADSAWSNFIYDRGLAEGWATIDPDTMRVKFNRKAAAELDRGEAGIRQAEALDEADALQVFQSRFADRVAGIEQQKGALLGQMDEWAGEKEGAAYEAWLAERDALNGLSMQPGVQDRLGQMEARTAYDQWEAEQAQRGADTAAARTAYDQWEEGQALRNAESNAIRAGMDLDAIDNAEELRLAEADLAGLRGAMTDEEVVREMLGTTLDSVEPATLQRAETGRGWEVYDRNGELLGTARTRGAAQKIADQQARRDREALLARARQMEADAEDEAINTTIGSPVYDSDIVGKIKLTDAQINAVQGILPRLDKMLDEAWLARRGESAFYNINDLGPQKRTFELTQGDMQALQDGIRRVMDDPGDLAGTPRLRALRNLADKLDTEMKLMEPEARAQRFVNDLLADTRQYIDHGEFCDPT